MKAAAGYFVVFVSIAVLIMLGVLMWHEFGILWSIGYYVFAGLVFWSASE